MTAVQPPPPPSARPAEAGPPPRLAVAVVGGVTLAVAGSPLAVTSRKARALVAYLALEGGRAAPRERLAGLLWGDVGEQQARTSLRQVVFELREALEARGCRALEAGRESIGLVPGEFEVDAEAVLRAVAAGSVPEQLHERPLRGEALLAGYEDLSPGFADWLSTTRQALQDRLLRALEHGYDDEGVPRRVRRLMAEAALRVDPLHEAACRTVMRIAAEDGETGVALRCYAALYDLLGVELDMEPAAPTQELVAEIKRGHLAPASPPRPAAPAPPDRPPAAAAQGGVPVIAVLPFRAVGADGPPAALVEGIADDIVAILAGLREPVVISGNSTRALRDPDLDVRHVAEGLGAQYLVSGTVRAAGAQVRITAELVDAASGAVVWGNAYDARPEAVHETQLRVAATLANTLVPRVNEAELRRSRRRPPGDLDVYHLLLRARDLIFRLERDAFERAGAMLREAALRDPDYPATHATLADWHSLRMFQGWSEDPAGDLAALEAAARAALRADPCHARALALLGHNRTIAERRYDEAMGLFERALQAAPNDAEAWMWSAPTFAYVGRGPEAVRRAERAIALSPGDPLLFRMEHFLGIAHYASGQYAEAAHWGRRSEFGNPNYTSNLRFTAAALAALGRAEEAAPLARRVLALEPGFRVSAMLRTQAFRDDAQRALYGRRLVEAGFPA